MSKALHKLLIANRGEIAIRIARAAEELGIATLSVFSEDDAEALHVCKTDARRALVGRGPKAYLDAAQLIRVAQESGCDALHPGYGFLSENAAFAESCGRAGIAFVGPRPEQLALLGDKLRARALAEQLGVPVARGSQRLADVAQARAFLASLDGAPALLKAASGGGGRGMRVVRGAQELEAAFARCQSEAESAFGDGALYMEELIPRARHIEVQVIGDARGALSQLGERECSLQRRHQKLIEIAPSPTLSAELRARLSAAALRMAAELAYQSLGTFEFLVGGARGGERFVFIEANPRLQVEHTVTEQVLGIDLVQAQLAIAGGASLAELGLAQEALPAPRGHAIQLRVNLERVGADGSVTPAAGTLRAFELPAGSGVRVESAGYAGYTASSSFDSLLLKLIVHSPEPSFAAAVRRARRALAELRIEGAATNLEFLQSVVDDPAFAANDVYTTFLEEHAGRLAAAGPRRRLASQASASSAPQGVAEEPPPDGTVAVKAALQGRLLSLDVQAGERVAAGQQLGVIEAMKMESAVSAPSAGLVQAWRVASGESVMEGQTLCWLAPLAADAAGTTSLMEEPAGPRADLAELEERHARLLDARRPEAVAKRRKTGQRTARENVADLCDEGSFFEYGGLALAAQRSTRSLQNLLEVSPADGVVTGVGTVNAAQFGAEAARAMVVAYDYTVFAGTQGHANHKKQDRMFELARAQELPVVLLAEGGGGRPGDTDSPVRPTLDVETFRTFASLSGCVPLVGVVSGRCFAGNAVLLGCCDVIIATENSNIGMGGPVMIEGAGLGSFAPEAVGPIEVQSKNGVVDVRVKDEAAAVAAAKQYLGYFQGTLASWSEHDAQLLRPLVPENRMRVYDMRRAIELLSDAGSVLELRREFGTGMITALARLQGRPVGFLANEPSRLAGAIDAAAADKAARFMQLCDAFGLPLISLCDTPGFMVGPEAEQSALVRHTCRMLVGAAALRVPLFCVVLRKAYGLGAMAMAGGHTHAPFFCIAWPSAEFGAMGLEGAVQLAFKKQLNAVPDPADREKLLRRMVEGLREQGKGINIASHLEIDDVIDPAETRSWLLRGLRALPPERRARGAARGFIDTW
jgi:acetyl/propionyl-CoA carboxylase alpha subunit/acetyl-CoA carboxylase carboxyltransferase component